MSDPQWPTELRFLQELVLKFVPGEPSAIDARLETANQADWDELNAGIMRLLETENLAKYRQFLELLSVQDPIGHARLVALVGAIMPIRGGHEV